jgi:hypothetical protein
VADQSGDVFERHAGGGQQGHEAVPRLAWCPSAGTRPAASTTLRNAFNSVVHGLLVSDTVGNGCAKTYRGLAVTAGALPIPFVTWCNQSSSRRSGGGGWKGAVSTVVQTACCEILSSLLNRGQV